MNIRNYIESCVYFYYFFFVHRKTCNFSFPLQICRALFRGSKWISRNWNRGWSMYSYLKNKWRVKMTLFTIKYILYIPCFMWDWFIILSICIKSEEYKMASIKFLFSDIKNSDCFHVVQNCLKTQKNEIFKFARVASSDFRWILIPHIFY